MKEWMSVLIELSIKNYILIESIAITFNHGLTVLTGETGSGKSMLIDALNFVSGMRSNSSVVGHHGENASVQAVFNATDPVNQLLNEFGIETDDYVLIQRTMTKEGRSTMRINGAISTLSMTQSIVNNLLDVHSQFDTQKLLDQSYQLSLIDSLVDPGMLQNYYKHSETYKKATQEFHDFRASEHAPEEIALKEATLKELKQFKPDIEDYEMTKQSVFAMESYEGKAELIEKVLGYETSLLQTLISADDVIRELDPALHEQFNNAKLELEDVFYSIHASKKELSFDPFEFDQLQSRLFEYQKLLKTYDSIESIQEEMADLELKIDQSTQFEDYLEDKRLLMEEAKELLIADALELQEARIQVASHLVRDMNQVLPQLRLNDALISFDLQQDDLGNATFMFNVQMNKGQAATPLHKTASGGEVSRVMLAMKSALVSVVPHTTLILDEIDTGVSGHAGLAMGRVMKHISKTTQVITISHLSSVAACADAHYKIFKDSSNDVAITGIEELSEKQRVVEMAEMMSGSQSDHALSAAAELLNEGQTL